MPFLIGRSTIGPEELDQLLDQLTTHGSFFKIAVSCWCGRKDSNLHALAGASPSSWCVCQFRHFRVLGGLTRRQLLSRRSPSCFFGCLRRRRLLRPGCDCRCGRGPRGRRCTGARVRVWPPAGRAPGAPTMNSTAAIVVARDSTVAPLRAPNAAWLLAAAERVGDVAALALLKQDRPASARGRRARRRRRPGNTASVFEKGKLIIPVANGTSVIIPAAGAAPRDDVEERPDIEAGAADQGAVHVRPARSGRRMLSGLTLPP